MADTRFRPTVYPLEARDVPAASGVTPAQVLAAQGFVEQTPSILGYFEDNFDVARVGGAGQALLSAADTNRGAVNTLTGFLHDALEAAAANPAAAEQLNMLAGGTGVLIVQALANATAADALAARLGAVRPVPPPPPPTGAGNSNIGSNDDQNPPADQPVASTPPPDGSRIVTAIPNLSDPGFTAVGTQGLRTRDVVVGSGTAAVTSTSKVSVRYRGFLASNGTVFDTNATPDKDPLPATVGPTPTVIQGFAQGLVGMKVGGIRDIDIPSELGYKDSSTGSIPPNSRLVFEVQLLAITG